MTIRMRIIVTRGQRCPAPIIATKKALNEVKKGESFQVITDSQTSLANLTRFLRDNKTKFSVNETHGEWTLTVTKTTADTIPGRADEYCDTEIPHFARGDFVIAVTSDKMGTGNDELGSMLMANFIKAIKDLEHLPAKIVFYNSGVILGRDDSPVIDHLKEIEKMGVKLLLCATCVDFYSLAEKIHIGTMSNMYEIAQAMASASNVIKP
jgi:selenium metabolism protein YedF